MNIQKTNLKKGFTLIELIVVITILAILGTIAFVNFNSYSGKARDSKRTSDLSSINGKLAIAMTDGATLQSLFTDNATYDLSAAPSIGGANTNVVSGYNAGIINYAALGLKSTEFKDPKIIDYPFAIATTVGVYELAATMEGDGGKTAKVIGNYLARSVSPTSFTSGTGTSTSISAGSVLKFTFSDTADIGKFRVGDLVSQAGFGTGSVSVVGTDNVIISTTGTGDGTAIALTAGAETAGLIGKVTDLATPVTDGNANLPYTW